MKRRLLATLLLSASILTGGVCFADTQSETSLQLLQFNPTTNILVGSTLNGIIGDFRRTASTVHVVIPNPGQLPPGPCRVLGTLWNLEVRRNTPLTPIALGGLLSLMGEARCPVTVTVSTETPTATDAQEITQIRPGD